MKVVAFNGSPRKDGNTTILINHVFRELEKEGAGNRIGPVIRERKFMVVSPAINVLKIRINAVP